MAATLSQVFVGLFNAATGAYANQFKASDANALASVVSLVAGKDLSNDGNYVNYVLDNLGVPASGAVRDAAFAAVTGLLATQGRGGAVAAAADYLANVAAKDSTNQYYSVGSAFVAKVAKADAFTAGHPWESNVATLVGAATGTGTGTSLTTGDDLLTGTSVNDVFSALADTLGDNDQILDTSTTDSDTFTVAFKTGSDMTVTPTIKNIEKINVNYSGLTGAEFDATNVTGATITYNLTATTSDGTATVDAAANNNVSAGSGVTKLVVGALKGGLVDAGSATTVEVTADAIATNTTGVSVAVHGDTALKVTSPGSTLAVTAINADKDAKVTVTGALGGAGTSDLVVGSGVGAITLKSTSAILKAVEAFKVAGLEVSTISGADTIDLGTSTVQTTTVTDNANTLTLDNVKSGTVNVNKSGTTIVVSGKESTSSATVNLNKDTPTLTVDTGGTYTVNAAAAVQTLTSLTYAGTTTLNVVGDVTASTFAQAATTDKLVIAGTGNVTATGTWSTSSVDASGLNGKLTATQSTALATTVLGGTGNDVIELINTTQTSSVTTGAGDDTAKFSGIITTAKVTANTGDGADTVNFTDLHSLAAATLTVTTGAGDDTIKLGSAVKIVTAATTKITVDGGDGVDTLDISTAASELGKTALTTGAITLSNVEKIKVSTAEVGEAVLNGKTFTVLGTTASDNNLTVIADAAKTTLDLSGITADTSLEQVTFDASAQTSAMTITGTNAKDVITLTGFADTVSTGDGKDTVTMDTACAGATVDLGAGNDTLVFIGSTTATDSITITGGAGVDTLNLTDVALTDTNKFTFTDFKGGSGGDVLKLSATTFGNYTVTDADNEATLVTAAMAAALGANIDNSGGGVGNYIIFDTAAHIAAMDISADAGGGVIAIASDTGAVYGDDNGDMSDMVKIGTINITGTLTTDNFLFA